MQCTSDDESLYSSINVSISRFCVSFYSSSDASELLLMTDELYVVLRYAAAYKSFIYFAVSTD